METRQRMVASVEYGKTKLTQIATRFFVYQKELQKQPYLRCDIGTNTPKPYKGRRAMRLTDEQRTRLDELIGDDPHLTLEELRTELQVNCSLSVIWDELQLLSCAPRI